jgi:hypothetical protein
LRARGEIVLEEIGTTALREDRDLSVVGPLGLVGTTVDRVLIARLGIEIVGRVEGVVLTGCVVVVVVDGSKNFGQRRVRRGKWHRRNCGWSFYRRRMRRWG